MQQQTYEVMFICTRTIQVQANTRREASSKARDEFYGDFDLSPDDFTSKVGVPLIDHTHLNLFLES